MIKALKIAALAAALTLPLGAAIAADAPFAYGGAAALQGPDTTSGPTEGMTWNDILHPSPDSWPVYSGNNNGMRYANFTQINAANIAKLQIAWSSNLVSGGDPGAQTGGDSRGTLANPSQGGSVRGASILFKGVLYTTAPSNIWALDAKSGKTLWHFAWKSRGGTSLSNRGVAMWGNYLFMETSDDYLVSVDARTGQERWHVEIAPFEEQFFSSTSPMTIKNHIIVGTGNDSAQAGRLQSFDPVTGKRQWILYTVPMNPGDPGLDTWKDLNYSRHGGGNPWVPGSYDPETNLYIFGTSEPKPAYFAAPRGNGDALFTCTQIAVDVDTGKMKWYYQTSPGDTHDWDSAQTPVLADITYQGKPRKVMITASRNGYFFVVDRVTGEHLVTSKFNKNSNWASGLNAKGQPVAIRAKDNLPSGALVSTPNGGSTNWPPPAYSPKTGLFYLPVSEGWAEYYTEEMDPRGNMGLGGKSESGVAGGNGAVKAIDPKTGKIVWSAYYPSAAATGASGGGGSGLMVTASNLVFGAGDAGFVARDALTGKPVWNMRINASGAPESYMLDGRQYILVPANSGLVALSLP